MPTITIKQVTQIKTHVKNGASPAEVAEMFSITEEQVKGYLPKVKAKAKKSAKKADTDKKPDVSFAD